MSESASLHTYRIHNFDVDAFGQVCAPRLLGYLLHSAGISADRLGFGISKLQLEGLTWVIGRIRIELEQALCVGDEIAVITWPSGTDRTAAWRDFRIERDGALIGRATSLWFVLDMTTRLPIRPHAVLPEQYHRQTEHLLRLPRSIERPREPVTIRRQFEVRQADIDLNQHVTAASYLAWALETVPLPQWRTDRFDILDVQFLEECHLDDSIVAESFAFDAPSLLHRISRHSDGNELARLVTRWVPREDKTATEGRERARSLDP